MEHRPFLLFLIFSSSLGENKYSKEANYRTLEQNNEVNSNDAPFRMAKINQVWMKARKVLSAGKLESLREELRLQDKQELTWKRLKTEGGDKDGLKEAQLRTRLLDTLNRYGLGRYQPPAATPAGPAPAATMHRLFKDKKLDRLWRKAERAGFSQEELKALREEFQHHQARLDEYFLLLEDHQQVRQRRQLSANSVHEPEEEPAAVSLKRNKSQADYKSRINELHGELQRGYGRLQVASVDGPRSRQFSERRVAALWQLARRADFSAEELTSLWAELKHYEERLQKLRHLQRDMLSRDLRHGAAAEEPQRTEGRRVYDSRIRERQQQVEKLHLTLEDRILSRHTEL